MRQTWRRKECSKQDNNSSHTAKISQTISPWPKETSKNMLRVRWQITIPSQLLWELQNLISRWELIWTKTQLILTTIRRKAQEISPRVPWGIWTTTNWTPNWSTRKATSISVTSKTFRTNFCLSKSKQWNRLRTEAKLAWRSRVAMLHQ